MTDVAFFLGAGASVPAGLPDMQRLSSTLLEQDFINDNRYNTKHAISRLINHPRSQHRGYLDFEVFLDFIYSCVEPVTNPLYYAADLDHTILPTDISPLLHDITLTSLSALRLFQLAP